MQRDAQACTVVLVEHNQLEHQPASIKDNEHLCIKSAVIGHLWYEGHLLVTTVFCCLQDKVPWLLQQPVQLATVVHQIMWCQTVEAALAQQQSRLNLSRCLENMQQQLSELSRAALGRLTSLERLALMCMITIDVHMRDVNDNLLR